MAKKKGKGRRVEWTHLESLNDPVVLRSCLSLIHGLVHSSSYKAMKCNPHEPECTLVVAFTMPEADFLLRRKGVAFVHISLALRCHSYWIG